MEKLTVLGLAVTLTCLSPPVFAQQGQDETREETIGEKPECTDESDRTVSEVVEAIEGHGVPSRAQRLGLYGAGLMTDHFF